MTDDPINLPSGAGKVAAAYPGIWSAYASLGKACSEAGPVSREAARLVKLALAIGALSEGAVHSHARRALEEGVTPQALEQVALMAIPTLGFPQAVRALTWIQDVTNK